MEFDFANVAARRYVDMRPLGYEREWGAVILISVRESIKSQPGRAYGLEDSGIFYFNIKAPNKDASEKLCSEKSLGAIHTHRPE